MTYYWVHNEGHYLPLHVQYIHHPYTPKGRMGVGYVDGFM